MLELLRTLLPGLIATWLLATNPATALAAPDGEAQRIPGWNVRYTVPANWVLSRAEGRVRVFQNPDASAMLLVAPGVSTTPAQVGSDLVALGGLLGLKGQATTDLHKASVAGRNAILGEYDLYSQSRRQRVRGRSVTLLSKHPVSLGLVLLADPAEFAAASALLDEVVRSSRIDAPTYNDRAVAALAGRWTYYHGKTSSRVAGSGSYSYSYEDTISFDGHGRFRRHSSSHVGATSSAGGDGTSSSFSSFGGDPGGTAGSYTVIGHSLIVTTSQGSAAFDYSLQGNGLSAGGRTYIRE